MITAQPPSGRVFPHSAEAEEGLLGSIFVDPATVLPKCELAHLTPAHLYSPQNSEIFNVMLRLHRSKLPVEVPVIAEELKSSTTFIGVNLPLKLVGLSSLIATTAQADYFIGKVVEFHTRREIILAANASVEEAYNYAGGDLTELTTSLKRRVEFAISGRPTDSWPATESIADLCAKPIALPPVLIEGIMYGGASTMLISGPSKSHKTFTAFDVAISISTGTDWIGFKTTKNIVLYLNLELQRFAAYQRFRDICRARGIAPPASLHLLNLRGQKVTLDNLQRWLGERIEQTGAKVVCIDPHYKVSSVSGMEENSNDDQGNLLASMENICASHAASLILTHHFAKGDASSKNAIDRASGGGVFARWGDVMMTFTPHKEGDDYMTVEMSLRNFAPIKPFVVHWICPRWVRDDENLNPSDLKTSRGPKEKNKPENALNALGDQTLTYTQWEKATGMTESTFKRKKISLIDDGLVEQIGILYRRTK